MIWAGARLAHRPTGGIMKRLIVVVSSLALGLAACQKQAGPEQTAQAPAATRAEAGTGGESAPAPVAPAAGSAPAARPQAAPAAAPVAPAPAAPAPTPRPLVLEAGTTLPIVVRATVSTKTARPEDRVLAELSEDVTTGGRVVLHAGSEVLGHVLTAVRPGRTKGVGELVVSFDEVREGGRSYKIETTRIDVTGKKTGGKDAKIAGGAAAAGALIGGIADGGSGAVKGGLIGGAAGGAAVLATRGEDVELRAGSHHRIELRSSLRLD
jgi:hypothetical protein